MPWNPIWPDGTKSVKANETPGKENTTYIETTIGNAIVGTNNAGTVDHFWNVDPTIDGHHRFVKLPGFVTGTPGVPTDPVFGVGIDSVFYSKTKLTVESTVQQDVQPFFKNVKQVMQVLGIRCCGLFNGSAASPAQNDILYSHNLALQPLGIDRSGVGQYTITFANALPSENYLVLGGAIRNSNASAHDRELIFYVQSDITVTPVKSTTTLKIMFKSDGGSLTDPLQGWFVCFGG